MQTNSGELLVIQLPKMDYQYIHGHAGGFTNMKKNDMATLIYHFDNSTKSWRSQ